MLKISGVQEPTERIPYIAKIETNQKTSKKIHVDGLFTTRDLGDFCKSTTVSICKNYQEGTPEEACNGVIAECREIPYGCVLFSDNQYDYYLPVYDPQFFAKNNWKRIGVIDTDKGYVLVLKKRKWKWILMFAFLALVSMAIYLLIEGQLDQTIQEVVSIAQNIV